VRHSGNPAFRRPSSNLARSSGRRIWIRRVFTFCERSDRSKVGRSRARKVPASAETPPIADKPTRPRARPGWAAQAGVATTGTFRQLQGLEFCGCNEPPLHSCGGWTGVRRFALRVFSSAAAPDCWTSILAAYRTLSAPRSIQSIPQPPGAIASDRPNSAAPARRYMMPPGIPRSCRPGFGASLWVICGIRSWNGQLSTMAMFLVTV
jgi:hypothetical protein